VTPRVIARSTQVRVLKNLSPQLDFSLIRLDAPRRYLVQCARKR